jgi:hypothetical protein
MFQPIISNGLVNRKFAIDHGRLCVIKKQLCMVTSALREFKPN